MKTARRFLGVTQALAFEGNSFLSRVVRAALVMGFLQSVLCASAGKFSVEGENLLRVVARDEEGGEIEGVVVYWRVDSSPAGDWQKAVARLGTAELNIPQMGFDLRLFVLGPGRVPQQRAVSFPLNGRVEEFLLERGQRVGGRVLDGEGRPVGEARVSLFEGELESEVEGMTWPMLPHFELTDAQGNWWCDHAPADLGRTHVRLDHPQYASVLLYPEQAQALEAERAPARALLSHRAVFLLQPGFSVHGVITGPGGRPIEGAKILAPDHPVWTSADGQFELDRRLPGNVLLVAMKSGHAPALHRTILKKGMKPLEIELVTAKSLGLRIGSREGISAPGALIEVTEWQGLRLDEWRWQADVDGEFRWVSAPAESFKLRVSHPEFQPAEIWVRGENEGRQGEQQIVLARRLQLSGRVKDAVTGVLISSFRVIPGEEVSGHFHWDYGQAVAGTNGWYSILFKPDNRARGVRIEAEGYLPAQSRAFQQEEEVQRMDFRLARPELLHGQVLFENGEPVVGAQVGWWNERQRLALGQGKFVHPADGQAAQTADDGRFSLAASAPRGLMAVHPEGFASVSIECFTRQSRLVLRPFGRIEGELRIGERLGTNQLVALAPMEEQGAVFQAGAFTSLTDGEGKFSFRTVPPGRVMIGRIWQAQISHGEEIEVQAGKTTRVRLGGSGWKVSGHVRAVGEEEPLDWKGGDHPAFLRPIRVNEKEDHPGFTRPRKAYWFSVQRDGSFQVEDIPPGKYQIEVHYHEASLMAGGAERCLGKISKEVHLSEICPPEKDLGILELRLNSQEGSTGGE